jgi:2-hydroxy-6-oxonona-2,4-dienedioate hydrolase
MIGRRWGEGPPAFVLLHGLGVASRMMAPLAVRIVDQGTVLAPDLPGFGANEQEEELSLTEQVAAVIRWLDERLDERRAALTLVGCSLGAQIALHVAASRPDWLRALVLASPTMDPAVRSWPAIATRWPLETALQSPSFWRLQYEDHGRAGLRRVLRTTRQAMDDRPEELLGSVEVPTLVLRGTRDPLVSDDWAERVAAGLPHGVNVRLPGARHAMTYEEPVAVAVAIERFLAASNTTLDLRDLRGHP